MSYTAQEWVAHPALKDVEDAVVRDLERHGFQPPIEAIHDERVLEPRHVEQLVAIGVLESPDVAGWRGTASKRSTRRAR